MTLSVLPAWNTQIDLLNGVDDLRTDQHWVDRKMRARGVAALALDVDRQMVGRGHNGPGPDGELADRQAGEIVHAVDFTDVELVHQPVLDHRPATGAALFRRLEDHHRGAGEIARLGEIARSAQQHGGVAVMAAGVHLAGNRRLVRQVGRLLDRQRVHVGAHADDFLGVALAAPDDADHAGAADPRHDLVAAEFAQLLGHGSGGARNVVQELRMRVQVVPPFGDVAGEVGDAVDDRHRADLRKRERSGRQCSKPQGASASSRIKRDLPIDRAGRRPYTPALKRLIRADFRTRSGAGA
jgi:hypothetical protein